LGRPARVAARRRLPTLRLNQLECIYPGRDTDHQMLINGQRVTVGLNLRAPESKIRTTVALESSGRANDDAGPEAIAPFSTVEKRTDSFSPTLWTLVRSAERLALRRREISSRGYAKRTVPYRTGTPSTFRRGLDAVGGAPDLPQAFSARLLEVTIRVCRRSSPRPLPSVSAVHSPPFSDQ
jgi:hypothetical protein